MAVVQPSMLRGKSAKIALAASLTALSMLSSAYGAGKGVQVDKVTRGSAQFQTVGGLTTIRAADRTIINYKFFNIDQGDTVRFIQPGAHSRVLNRIAGIEPTKIDGTLQANGIVYFVNPSGIVFGAHSVLDVGQIYAAGGNITDSNFLANINRFALTAPVSNLGAINGEQVHLLGTSVANEGSITAEGGLVSMVAGDQIMLGTRDGHILVKVGTATVAQQPAGGSNLMGAGDMYSFAIKNTGTIKASDVHLEAQGSGTVAVSGKIDVTNTAPGGVGGNVVVTGGMVALNAATVDASGTAGGGTVRIGGDMHGQGDIRTASQTSISSDSLIRADALTNGNGGMVIVWSDQLTQFSGAISARGGALGGDGGFAEVSGRQLAYSGKVDLQAPNGKGGNLLIDPFDLEVVDDGTLGAADSSFGLEGDTVNDGDTTTYGLGDNPSLNVKLQVSTITDVLKGGETVTLAAEHDLTVNSAIDVSGNAGASGAGLNLRAGNNLTINNAIDLNGGVVDLHSNDPTGGFNSGVGNVVINAPINTHGGSFHSAGVGFDNSNNGTLTVISASFDHTGNVILAHAGDLHLSSTTIGGSLELTNTTNLTVDAAQTISVGGPTTISLTTAGSKLTLGAGASIQNTTDGVTLAADKMDLGGAITATGQRVILEPFTGGKLINLGSAVDTTTNTLELSSTELNNITAGVLQIGQAGGSASGNITISAAIGSGAPWSTLSLITGGGITETTGSIVTTSAAFSASSGVTLASANNSIGTIAASVTNGGYTYTDSGSVTVGTVDSVVGITTAGSVLLTTDSLHITQPIATNGGSFTANIANDITSTVAGTINTSDPADGGSAGIVDLEAGTTINLGGSVTAAGTDSAAGNGGDGASVTIIGTQVTLAGVISSGGNALSVDQNGGSAGPMTILGTGVTNPAITLNGNLSAVGGTASGIGTAGLGGEIDVESSAQLGSNITAGGSSVQFFSTLDGTTNGGESLTITGDAVFADVVGGTTPLKSVSVSGFSTIQGGAVTTVGDQSYTSGLTIGVADLTLDTGGGNVLIGSVAGGGKNLILAAGIGAGTTTFTGNVVNLGSGTGAALTVQSGVTGLVDFQGTLGANSGLVAADAFSNIQFDDSVTLANGDTATSLPGHVQFSAGTFSGFDGLTFGTASLSGGAVTLNSNSSNILLRAINGGGENLTVDAGATGTFKVTGNVDNIPLLTITNSNGVEFMGTYGAGTSGAVTVTDTRPTGIIQFDGGANITLFTSTSTANTYGVAFNAGTGGQTSVLGTAFFGNTGILSLGNNSADQITFSNGVVTNNGANHPSVTGIAGTVTTVTGPLTLGPVSLGADTTLNSTGNNITISSLDGGAHNLTLAAGIGAGTTTVTGNVSNLGTGTGAALTIQSGVTGLVDFQGTLGAASGLIAASSTSNVQFDKDVTLADGDTATSLPGAVTLNNVVFSSFDGMTFGAVTLAGGAVTLNSNGSNIQTAAIAGGAQNLILASAIAAGNTTFNGNITNLGTGTGDAVLIQAGVTGLVDFKGTLAANSGIAANGTDSNVTFEHDVALASGTVSTNLPGAVALNGMTFSSHDGMTFGHVTLSGTPNTLNSNGGDIHIATLTGASNLVLAAGIGAGTTSFTGAVSNLGSNTGPALTVTSGITGLVLFNSSVTANSGLFSAPSTNVQFNQNVTIGITGDTTTSLEGNVLLNGVTFTTSRDMTFGAVTLASGPVTLNSNGANIQMSTLDGGGQNLILASGIGVGTTVFTGNVTNLGTGTGAALTVSSGVTGLVDFQGTVTANSGLSAIDAGSDIKFEDNVTLANGSVGTNFAGLVEMSNTTFSGFDGLTFNTATLAGPVTIMSSDDQTVAFTGAVNGGGGVLTVNTAGITRFSSTVNIGSLTTNAGGTTHIDGGSITTGTGQTYNDDVLLGGDTVITQTAASNGVTFAGSVNDATAGQGNLTLAVSGATTTFTGAVGNLAPLGSGTGTAPAITINSAAGTTIFNNTVSIAAGFLQDDAAGVVIFNSPITVAARGVGSVFNSNVTLNNGITFTSAGDVQLGNASSDFITLGGSAVTVTTAAANKNITINSKIDSTASSSATALVLNSGTGNTVATGAMGSVNPLATLTTDAGGTSSLASVTTTGAQLIQESATTLNGAYTSSTDSFHALGNVTLAGDTTISVGTNKPINIDGTTNGAHALTLKSTGGTITVSTLGDATALTSLAVQGQGTSAAGSFTSGSVINATNTVTINAPVVLNSSSHLTTVSGAGVTFKSTIDSASAGVESLTVNDSANTTLGGNVGTTGALKDLIFSPATAGSSATTFVEGNITTQGGRLAFGNPVDILADVVIERHFTANDVNTGPFATRAGIYFNSSVDSFQMDTQGDLTNHPFNLTVLADPNPASATFPIISFTSPVGGSSPFFNLHLNSAAGNADGIRGSSTPAVATIIATPKDANGNLLLPGGGYGISFNVTNDFTMGRNEKLSSLGSLTISGGVSTANLGDLSALGGLTLQFGNINFQRRAGGAIELADGSTANDHGVDIVAGGAITVSAPIIKMRDTGDSTIDKDGSTNVVFASGAIPTSQIGGFRTIHLAGTPTIAQLVRGQPANPEVLDLTSTGFSIVSVDAGNALAGAIKINPSQVSPPTAGPDNLTTVADLSNLGIHTRDLTPDEMLQGLNGHLFFVQSPADMQVAAARLNQEGVFDLVRSYQTFFFTNPDGQLVAQNQKDHIRDAMARALAAYHQQHPKTAAVIPTEFRQFVASTPEHRAVLSYLSNLNSLIERLRYLGLTTREQAAAKAAILKDVIPAGIKADEFEALVTTPSGQMAMK